MELDTFHDTKSTYTKRFQKNKTVEQRKIREKLCVKTVERGMLEELKVVLEAFEFVTDELQSNKINISRLYPYIMYLRSKLNAKDTVYTTGL